MPYSWGRLYQAIKRLDRRGQEKEVKVINLRASYPAHRKGSIDVGIDELVHEKRNIIEYVVRGGKVKLDNGELVSDSPVSSKRPIEDRLYTSQQHLRRIMARMTGRSSSSNQDFLYKNDGRMAKEYAEAYSDEWEFSYSAKTAQVYKRIIEGLMEGGEELYKMIDIASGPAILSWTLGIPVTNLDINKEQFEKAKEMGAHPDNLFVKGLMHELFFEDGQFDLAVCSLGLQYTELERTEKGRYVREREKAIREANRVLRTDGYYLITLPDYLEMDEYRFYEGLERMGFEVINELSGRVVATEPKDSRFAVKVITAKKVGSPADEIGRDYFEFNIDREIMESVERKRNPSVSVPPKSGAEICTDFAFYSTGKRENIERRVNDYLTRYISDDVRRQVDSLPLIVGNNGLEYLVTSYRNSLTVYTPRVLIERLLEEFRQKHPGITRRELRERDNYLYNKLRKLRLLNLIPQN